MTFSSGNRVRQIEHWFHDHENGEFVVATSGHRLRMAGSHSAARTVIYTTKIHCLRRNLCALDVAHPVVIVGRCGLPVSTDLIHLDGVPVGASCYFVGDADPPDILTFAWLRERVAIRWLGVNDQLLDRNSVSDRGLLEIAMSNAEKQMMRKLPDLCPDFRHLLGPHCSNTLDLGFRIELEGAMINHISRPGR